MELFLLSVSVLSTAVAGGSGDTAAESDSPQPFMTFELAWELPAQGPNVSKASPAGMRAQPCLVCRVIPWPIPCAAAQPRTGNATGAPHGVPELAQQHQGHCSVLTAQPKG